MSSKLVMSLPVTYVSIARPVTVVLLSYLWRSIYLTVLEALATFLAGFSTTFGCLMNIPLSVDHLAPTALNSINKVVGAVGH